jgi:hypothetical protein
MVKAELLEAQFPVVKPAPSDYSIYTTEPLRYAAAKIGGRNLRSVDDGQ